MPATLPDPNDPLILVDREEIVEALISPDLAPVTRPGEGATLKLRSQMARFSTSPEHAGRRTAVLEVLAVVTRGDLEKAVRSEAAARCEIAASGSAQESRADALGRLASDFDRSIPVAALAATVGLVGVTDRAAVELLVADVHALVEVIGHGLSSSPAADASVDRLLRQAGSLRGGSLDPVAVVSVLYQCVDATANLLGALRTEQHGVVARPPAVKQTARVAQCRTAIAGYSVAAGSVIELRIGDVGLEFGHGPHACPASDLANILAASMLEALSG